MRKRQREEMERLIEEQNRPLMGDIRRDFTPLYSQEEEIRLGRELDEKEQRGQVNVSPNTEKRVNNW
jgi:hypothetical protein